MSSGFNRTLNLASELLSKLIYFPFLMFTNSRRKRSLSCAYERSSRTKHIKKIYEIPDQPKGDGHFRVLLGDSIDREGRYKIITYLGDGTFGKVVLAFDRVKRFLCAIKIVRKVDRYIEDAQFEIKNMKIITREDPDDEAHCVRHLGAFFNDSGHLCIMMSQHGPNLLHHISNRSLAINFVADICFQLLEALNFLHNKLHLVHTDLKPENILSDRWIDTKTPYDCEYTRPWRQEGKSSDIFFIRLCDFGGCQKEAQSRIGQRSIIQTRHYRAPEVVLRVGWHCAADIWSVGCIAFELATGNLLYETHDDREHLAMMQMHLGSERFPFKKWENLMSKESLRWFDTKGVLLWPPKASSYMNEKEYIDSIKHVAKQEGVCSLLRTKLGPCPELEDFILRCLKYDPDERLKPEEGLTHPFIRRSSEKFEHYRSSLKRNDYNSVAPKKYSKA